MRVSTSVLNVANHILSKPTEHGYVHERTDLWKVSIPQSIWHSARPVGR